MGQLRRALPVIESRRHSWARLTTRHQKTTIYLLPVSKGPSRTYRVHREPWRVAESRRPEHRRGPLRDAPRDGDPRPPDGRRRVGIRSAAAPDVDPRAALESLRAARLRAAEIRRRGTVPVSI